MRELEVVGEPINVTLFTQASERDFMHRRKIVFTVYATEDQLDLYTDYEQAAKWLGESLGELLYQGLSGDSRNRT